ncbi:Very low-density lipoprotein receptor [Apiospora arundinis]|uniref:Very low-density lipoprotein receptor n=1 Tax=Apiospora arundinis TaxID=335852 RepID=A0ABR2JGI7_9PEZI
MPQPYPLWRRSALAAVALWIHLFLPGTLGALVFVNPVQKLTGEAVDFETNTIHPVGSSMTVEWTSDDVPKDPLSLLLFQNGSPPEDAEHIFRNVTFTNKKSHWPWTVVTNQTLDHSHAFSFSLFFEGKQNPEAISREFNITISNGTAQPPPPSTTTAKISSTPLDTSSSTIATATASSSPSTTGMPDSISSNGNGSLTVEQKMGLGVGLGVGIPLLALLGLCSFLLYRQKKNREEQQTGVATDAGSGVYLSEAKYSRDDDMESQQQHGQVSHITGELAAPTPLYEAETPPDDSPEQRQGRGPVELGDYQGVELHT